MKFQGDPSNSIIIPLYYPNKNSYSLSNASKSGKKIIDLLCPDQYLKTEHDSKQILKENDDNQFQQHHAEKALLVFFYKYHSYFAKLSPESSEIEIGMKRK